MRGKDGEKVDGDEEREGEEGERRVELVQR